MGAKQKAQLRRMVDFKFTRHPSLNLPEQRLTAIEKQLGERTRELLSIPVQRRLSDEQPQVIAGFREDVVEVLEPSEIYRVFAESGKVFAETNHGEYALRLRLYEVEQRLDSKTFVRISNSDIINLRKVKSFDLSFVGTICITLSNGTVTYVSRRSVAKIKQLLGM